MKIIKKVISIDTGNAYIKTPTEKFPAGYANEGNRPSKFQQADTILYDGSYYKLTNTRVPYHRDKTTDEDYYILSLFAIGKELAKDDNIPKDGNTVIHLDLVMGLPPKHFNEPPEHPHNQFETLRDAYRDYFLKESQEVVFYYNDIHYRIVVDDVMIFPQGYAAVFHLLMKIKKNIIYIIDIGGHTTDIYLLDSGEIDPTFTQSMTMGTNILFKNIRNRIKEITGIKLHDSQIFNALIGSDDLPIEIRKKIDAIAEKYATTVIEELQEGEMQLKYSQLIFSGGGSLLLKKYFTDLVPKDTIFIDDLCANAKGYKYIYDLIQKTTKKEEED